MAEQGRFRPGTFSDSRVQSYHCTVGTMNPELAVLLKDSYSRHAGYAYSGQAAAWAYKCIDTTGMSFTLIRTT